MNVYTTDKIRNVVLLGHGGSGKPVQWKRWHIYQALLQEWVKLLMAIP